MAGLERELQAAIEAARAAGDVILGADRAHLAVRAKSSPRDLVTEADERAQRVIVEILRRDFPDYGVLGEEGDTEGKPGCDWKWIVDPIDGTTNFLHGKPLMGPIIALRNGRQTVLGVLYLPRLEELFHGTWGGGVFRNDEPVRLRDTRDLDDAIVCTNVSRRLRERGADAFPHGIPHCGSLENYGCAIEAFAAVLRGQNDGVVYEGPHLWDVEAGCFLIQEAGGKARWELIDPANPRGSTRCVAATRKIFAELEPYGFGTSGT